MRYHCQFQNVSLRVCRQDCSEHDYATQTAAESKATAKRNYFEQYVGRLCRELGPHVGEPAGFDNVIVDSYEVGCQNWTPGFENEFLSSSAVVAEKSREHWRRLICGADADDALKALKLEPDVIWVKGNADTSWDHRRTPNEDIYFICRNNERRETLTCSFRVCGRTPELWDALSGERTVPREWRQLGDRIEVTFDLETCGSVFVIFRDRPSDDVRQADRSAILSERLVEGPWEVSFSAKYDGVPAARRFDRLVTWTESEDLDLRYLSGSGTYEKSLDIEPPEQGERVVLDLGEVWNFAEVTVNGHAFAPLWKPPYRIDITSALAPGRADVSVRVTNLWPNRLIGDDALPPDVEWKKPEGVYQPIKEIPQWVKSGQKSPTGRHTFTTWRFWKAGDPLLPSGLLGPVKIEVRK